MEYSVGIDLGGTNIAAAVVDCFGKIVCKNSCKTNLPKSSDILVDDIFNLISELLDKADIRHEYIKTIGIGAPGLVNAETRTIEYSCNFDYYNEPLAEMLEKKIKKPVSIENDANVAALGEYIYMLNNYIDGLNGRPSSLVAITLGTGIGGGIVLNGKIFHGSNFSGGEVGHMVIKKGGRLCNCGRKGCFETYASATGLVKTTKELMSSDEGKTSKMWSISKNQNKISGKTAFDAAKLGDGLAKKAIDVFISDLGTGIVNLVNIFQPDVLTIGGGISKEGDLLTKPLQAILDMEDYAKNSKKRCKVCASKLGNDAGLIGAAMQKK